MEDLQRPSRNTGLIHWGTSRKPRMTNLVIQQTTNIKKKRCHGFHIIYCQKFRSSSMTSTTMLGKIHNDEIWETQSQNYQALLYNELYIKFAQTALKLNALARRLFILLPKSIFNRFVNRLTWTWVGAMENDFRAWEMLLICSEFSKMDLNNFSTLFQTTKYKTIVKNKLKSRVQNALSKIQQQYSGFGPQSTQYENSC